MLIARGARVHTTNMGDDTPLHLAAAHGNRDIVNILLRNKADVNFINEHGNTALHYACFWNYPAICEDLVEAGALVNIENKYRETPLEKSQGNLAKRLQERAIDNGQDVRKKLEFRDQSWLGLKTRSRDATLSRHKGININELYLHTKIAQTATGETWRGKWQGNEIAAKILALRECTPRISRDFNEEYPKLRFVLSVTFLTSDSCQFTLNIWIDLFSGFSVIPMSCRSLGAAILHLISWSSRSLSPLVLCTKFYTKGAAALWWILHVRCSSLQTLPREWLSCTLWTARCQDFILTPNTLW